LLVGVASSRPAIEVMNDRGDPITLGQAALSGPDAAAFRVTSDTCGGRTLASGEGCAVSVTFWPRRLGTHAATVQVPVVGDASAPYTAALSGEGIPWLRITPSVLDFGTVLASPVQEVLVENVSGRAISTLRPRTDPLTGAFRVDRALAAGRCGTTLAAGASCRVGVSFVPRTAGPHEARLLFVGRVGEDLGSAITLRGTGATRPSGTPIGFPTPNATAMLRKRLRLALQRLGRSRKALLKRGLVVRGIVPPADGNLRLTVHARRASSAATLVAARRRVPVQAGRRTTIRARVTRAGRRLLKSGRRLVLDVRLTLVARTDQRVSEANRVLRLRRAR
jgi:hypothetical protein